MTENIENLYRELNINTRNLYGLMSKEDTNSKRRAEIEKRLSELNTSKDFLISTFNDITKMYKEIVKNSDEKRETELSRFNSTILETSKVVPSANLGNVSIKVGNNTAAMVNNNEQDINRREGSAARGVIGQFLRYLIILDSGMLPIMLLDETFFTLSDNSSTSMKEYIEKFSKDMLVIVIEQHNSLFAGVEGKIQYTFNILDGKTNIRRTSIDEAGNIS